MDLNGGPPQLFNLADDPGERINLSARFPGVMASLHAAIDQEVAARRRQPTPATATLDSATRERLRALGYLE